MRRKGVVSRQSGELSEETKDISLGNGAKGTGREFTCGSEDTACSDAKACRQVKQKRKAKGSMDANNSWWVSELLAAACKKKVWLSS